MSQIATRRIATLIASTALLSGLVAATGSEAFAVIVSRQPVHQTQDQPKKEAKQSPWDHGADPKKDKWDSKHRCWIRWDAESHSYARWDNRSHSWTRVHMGHAQKWDTKRHQWK